MAKKKSERTKLIGNAPRWLWIIVLIFFISALALVIYFAFVVGGIFVIWASLLVWLGAITLPCLAICVIFFVLLIILAVGMYLRGKAFPRQQRKSNKK